ncbi:lactonase family protein [Pontibacter sp. BT327]|uniref:Lactonase family protein n=1 Tax=Pontibacter burrus TaxID=2704466 RepID=A0A6B3LPC8_9BACT|nr:lactonase family protein [Pontibacter burrus]
MRPREFNLENIVNFLLVVNQHPDTVVTFRIDKATGRLTPTGFQVQVPKPVFVKVFHQL